MSWYVLAVGWYYCVISKRGVCFAGYHLPADVICASSDFFCGAIVCAVNDLASSAPCVTNFKAGDITTTQHDIRTHKQSKSDSQGMISGAQNYAYTLNYPSSPQQLLCSLLEGI